MRALLSRVLRHPIARNVMALSWMQAATFLIPLITLPYLSRTLAASGFGLVVFSQGFSFLLGLVIQYGFDQYSTREVAAARDDPAALEASVHRVLSAKALLIVAATVVAAVSYFAVPQMHRHPDLLALAWLAAVANGLVPGWFFIGLERVRLVSIAQLVIRATAAALTFVLVTGRGDAWVVMALYAGGSVVVLVFTTVLMYREVGVRGPAPRVGVDAIRAAWPLFVTLVSLAFVTSMNVVMLGFFASSAEVAHFGAAERIVRAALLVFGPIGIAIYPRLVYLQSQGEQERAWRLLSVAALLLGGLSVAIVVGLAFASPTIIRVIFGPGYHESVPLLRALALLIPLSVATSTAGAWLQSLKRDRLVARIVVRVAALNVALGVVLAPTLGAEGMTISILLAELSAMVMVVAAVLRARPSRAAAA